MTYPAFRIPILFLGSFLGMAAFAKASGGIDRVVGYAKTGMEAAPTTEVKRTNIALYTVREFPGCTVAYPAKYGLKDPWQWAVSVGGYNNAKPGTNSIQNVRVGAGLLVDCNNVPGGTAFIDNCSNCVGGTTGLSACVQDCDGVWGGTAFIDNCGSCVAGVSGIPPCLQDCAGVWGGTAQPGTPCDDGSIATENDQWDINCNCSGTTINCTSDAGPDISACGSMIQLQASGEGTWIIPPQLQIDDVSSPNAQVTAPWAGSFDLIWEVSIVGCTAQDIVTIEFLHVPDPAFDYPQDSVCTTDPGYVPSIAEEGGLFSSTGNLNIHQVTGSFNPMNSQPGTYVITYSFAGECPVNSSAEITITQSPSATWTSPGPLCSDDEPLALNDLITGSPGGQWSGIGVVDEHLVPSQVNGSSTVTYTASVLNCSSSISQVIAVNTSPIAQAGPNAFVCGQTVQLQAQGSGSWSLPAGAQADDPNAPDAFVTVLNAGNHDFIWTTEQNGCSASDTVEVVFQSIADASFNYAQSTYCTGDMPPSPWFAQDDGVFSSPSMDIDLDPVSGSFDPGSSIPGTYEISYSIGGPCPSSSSVEVTIMPSPDANWDAMDLTCSNEGPLSLNPLVSGTTGGSWSGDGIQNGLFHPSLIVGTAWVQYTVTTGSCTSSQIDSIPVMPTPEPFAGEDVTVCGLSQTLQAGPFDGNGTWSTVDELSFMPSARDPNATVHGAAAGSYILTWTVTNNGCSGSDEIIITLLDPDAAVWVDAGPDLNVMANDHAILTGSATAGSELSWQVIQGSGLFQDAFSANTGVYGLGTGENVIMLSATVDGCASGSDTLIVRVEDFHIPQGFSPNADGVNDVFDITGIAGHPGSGLLVFNRWGQEVFQNLNYDGKWDGRSNNGADLPNDTYFYVLNLSDGPTYNGHVIIKR